VQDWVLLQLTGRYATDHTFASRTNLYGLEMRNWDARLLDLFGVPHRMLCDLVAPGAVVGGLTREMASLTGLANGLPVVTAGGDQQCAALGLGLFSPQLAVANIGTGAFVIGHSDKPVFDDSMRVSCNVSAAPGAYIVEAAMLTSGAAHRWVMDLMFPHQSEAMFADFEREAAEAPAGANGVVLLPHFKGSGSPHWDPVSRASFCNLSLSTTRADIARAILEGIAFELKEGLELVEALCGPASRVNASGGMTRSELFNRILCDVFESSLRRFWGSEATVQGAWIAGAVATGLASNYSEASARLCDLHPPTDYRPAAESRDIYRLQRRRAGVVYEALASVRVRELF
jgi:sugar (pentulose or hexulose) kinase